MKPVLTSPEDVQLKCDYFVDVHLWPLKQVLNPEGWLKNFTEAELPYAGALLNAFLYFSELLVDTIYRSAFDDLVHHLRSASDTAFAVDTKWRAFQERVILTYSTGEIPNPTDSGYLFARKARQILGIPEERIVPPEQALELMAQEDRPIVFVDDFVGTGNQFVETWTRENQSGPVRIAPSGSWNHMFDSNPNALFDRLAGELNRFGLAYLHIVEPRVKGNVVSKEGLAPVAAQELRRIFEGRIVAAGGFEADTAEKILREGDADLVAFGRHFLANPDLPMRIEKGLALNDYDRSTFYTFAATGYTDYPFYHQ